MLIHNSTFDARLPPQGILLQIFTRPLGDRPTVFIEIIQRLGCMRETEEQKVEQVLVWCRATIRLRFGCMLLLVVFCCAGLHAGDGGAGDGAGALL